MSKSESSHVGNMTQSYGVASLFVAFWSFLERTWTDTDEHASRRSKGAPETAVAAKKPPRQVPGPVVTVPKIAPLLPPHHWGQCRHHRIREAYGRCSSRNATLQKSLAVKSRDHSKLACAEVSAPPGRFRRTVTAHDTPQFHRSKSRQKGVCPQITQINADEEFLFSVCASISFFRQAHRRRVAAQI